MASFKVFKPLNSKGYEGVKENTTEQISKTGIFVGRSAYMTPGGYDLYTCPEGYEFFITDVGAWVGAGDDDFTIYVDYGGGAITPLLKCAVSSSMSHNFSIPIKMPANTTIRMTSLNTVAVGSNGWVLGYQVAKLKP